MNVLLIMPRYIINEGEWYTFPLGLPYISASLKKAKVSVTTLNLNHLEDTIENTIKRSIEENSIDIVGISVTHILYDHCQSILNIVKSINTSIITIIGGGVVSGDPQAAMLAYQNADIGIIGEGEYTFPELVSAIENNQDLHAIPGIIVRTNGHIFRTETRGDIADISSLPWPDYEGFSFEKTITAVARDGHISNNILPILSSRSCPFHCSFCFHTCGSSYRTRDLDEFFAELSSLLKKYPINLIVIYDELLTYDKKRLRNFCARIREFGVNWACSLRADMIDSESLDIMRYSNCINASFGIEHIHPNILDSMDKHITQEQINVGLELLYKKNFAIDGNILFGDIAENLETVKAAASWLRRNSMYGINICHILTLPGSKVYRHARENGQITSPSSYLQSGEFDLNLTNVSIEEYGEMIHEIDILESEYQFLPNELSISILPKSHFANARFTCTRCKNTVVTPPFFLDGRIRISCPICRHIYMIHPFDHYLSTMQLGLSQILQNKRTVSILGRTRIAYQLSRLIQANFRKIQLRVIDYHHRTCTVNYFGIPTVSLERAQQEPNDIVISCISHPELLDICNNYAIHNLFTAAEILTLGQQLLSHQID